MFRSLHRILPAEEFGDVDLCLCRGFLIDGDHAIKWREGDMASSGRSVCCIVFMLFGSHSYFCSVQQGTLPFMSSRLLRALQWDERVLHTPADDLESFLWVLVWSLVYILTSKKEDNNEGSQEDNDEGSQEDDNEGSQEDDNEGSQEGNDEGSPDDNYEDLGLHKILTALSSRYIPDILDREASVEDWPDMVFRDLIHEWLEIARDSRRVVTRLQKAFLRSSDNDAREINLDEIEECSRAAYEKFFQAGYKHLRGIRRFSDWEAVVKFTQDYPDELL